ncbi:uncharacterized protein C8Q71DRAFT_732949 [Rhodofomes roseus]|uniref:DUF6697 domain-containing protein n=1 Tax=Rhodofomes roseus TaxID=34475 RepID=A0ABQ8KUG5_9APHY|nr:uncharacterized protein C8Q71DRAFT_732949 [Rhodofomes roseus]KAH9842461.1 hypothetical protein C8Q71DRAFT_732949 [Rhodofomes roseus]
MQPDEIPNGETAANDSSSTDAQYTTGDALVTSAELRLERLRLNDALSARDAVVEHLTKACISIRQKSDTINKLEHEKADLETQLSRQNGHAYNTGGRADRAAGERVFAQVQVEVGNLAEIFRRLEGENRQLKAQVSGEQLSTSQQTNVAPARPSDWQVSLHKILRSVLPPPRNPVTPGVPSDGQSAPTTTPASSHLFADSPTTRPQAAQIHTAGTLPAPVTAPPDDRLHARNAVLAALPLTSDVPVDVLKPIVIPSQFTFQDFVTTLPVALRQQIGGYRLLQENATFWCTEREEHGYFLTPLFKCTTNPRVTTVHRWIAVDLGPQLNKTTECFYNKDGLWYYTGLYKTLWLDELSPAEWGSLSSETTQALVKQTLTARKNTAPQNVYETGQLYTAGALRVACIGLQCVGFSHAVYSQVMEAAERCTQTGRWRSTQAATGSGAATGPGSFWTPPSPKLSPRALSTASGSPCPVQALSPHVQTLSPHAPSLSPRISILSPPGGVPAALGDACGSPAFAGVEDPDSK